MSAEHIRILSDVHYGDRASRVDRLEQLRPLFDGVDQLVFNGDTLDTRPGPLPDYTSELRAQVLEMARVSGPKFTFLTGNHDPDFTPHHLAELAAGEVVATHGDIVFDDIVPWSRDARVISRKIDAELGKHPRQQTVPIETRFDIWRRVAASIPQRHQSEKHTLKYMLHYAMDTVWPPTRVVHVLRAWKTHAPRAAEFARTHHPRAKFILIGHTHRPGIWQSPGGTVVINTGSFCPPLGGYAVDLTTGRLLVRRVELRNGEFRIGEKIAEFPLAHG